jgi:hypothetical protein
MIRFSLRAALFAALKGDTKPSQIRFAYGAKRLFLGVKAIQDLRFRRTRGAYGVNSIIGFDSYFRLPATGDESQGADLALRPGPNESACGNRAELVEFDPRHLDRG